MKKKRMKAQDGSETQERKNDELLDWILAIDFNPKD